MHDLSLESGEPVFITRDGEVDGVFFSMEAFKTLQNDLLLMLEDVVMKGRYLEDIISMHNGGGCIPQEAADQIRAELEL